MLGLFLKLGLDYIHWPRYLHRLLFSSHQWECKWFQNFFITQESGWLRFEDVYFQFQDNRNAFHVIKQWMMDLLLRAQFVVKTLNVRILRRCSTKCISMCAALSAQMFHRSYLRDQLSSRKSFCTEALKRNRLLLNKKFCAFFKQEILTFISFLKKDIQMELQYKRRT